MEKETSCINSRAILDYIKEHNENGYSSLFEDLDPEIDAMPDPEFFLRGTNNWISNAVASRLYERARTILHDDMAAYKMAKFAVENTSLGYAQRILVKALWSYKTALKHVQKLNDKWNRNKRVELVEIKRSEALVRLHWFPNSGVSKDTCLYNKGVYKFMPLIWGGRPNWLHENCCYFEDAPYCEFHLKWTPRNKFHEIFSRFFTSKSVLMETVREMEEDKEVIEQKYDEVNRLNVDLNNKIKQLMAIQETGKAILSVLDQEQLLSVIMNLLFNVCQINRAIIMLANEESGYLEYLHGVGFEDDVPEMVKKYRAPLDRVSNLLVRVASTGQPEYIPEIKNSSLRKENIMITHGNPKSAYVVPLITRSKVIGVLATDAVDGEGVPKETRETLEIFASQIAIALENARLYRKLQLQMKEIKQSQVLLSRTEKFSFLGNLAARLAHEIKNPMTAIGTFIQLLPAKYEDEEFRDKFHRIAMEETNRVNNLITELLDLVKTKESHFKFDDVHSLIDKMVLLVSPQSNAKGITVTRIFDVDMEKIWIDDEKMKQVILNLLSNAVDFTPKGGRIDIITKKGIEEDGNDIVTIEIRDNGVGIEDSMINRIFDPYFTTKHKSALHRGTGLGLFIAHQNMQDHGGTIDVKSRTGEGAAFILTLPAKPLSNLPIDSES